MMRAWRSAATGLAIAYGAGVGISCAVVALTVYWGTVGVLNASTNAQINAASERLVTKFAYQPQALIAEINRELNDGINSDTEIFEVTSPSGRPLVGNLSAWPHLPQRTLSTAEVVRNSRAVRARLRLVRLDGGYDLIVGRDLEDQNRIRKLIIQSLTFAGGGSLLLMAAAGFIFKRLIDRRLGAMRATAAQIEAGDYAHRIPESHDDEFGRLGRDINRMLDRIQNLMEGVRHVSNAIAHDLRTPLNRLRNELESAIENADGPGPLSQAAVTAVAGIDEIIRLFENLLQIAEAESGVRTRVFDAVDLASLAIDISELYEASAEEAAIRLEVSTHEKAMARGDRNLLATAVASLIDNAIKYAGPGALIRVQAKSGPHGGVIEIVDNGPGIPIAELERVTERFYRLDYSLPGHGLGLSIVAAIAQLHGGALRLSDANPGLIAQICLPSTRDNLSNL